LAQNDAGDERHDFAARRFRNLDWVKRVRAESRTETLSERLMPQYRIKALAQRDERKKRRWRWWWACNLHEIHCRWRKVSRHVGSTSVDVGWTEQRDAMPNRGLCEMCLRELGDGFGNSRRQRARAGVYAVAVTEKWESYTGDEQNQESGEVGMWMMIDERAQPRMWSIKGCWWRLIWGLRDWRCGSCHVPCSDHAGNGLWFVMIAWSWVSPG